MRDKLRPPPRLSGSLSKRSAPNGPKFSDDDLSSLKNKDDSCYGLEKSLAKCDVDALTNGQF
jgi:hypothetical protein